MKSGSKITLDSIVRSYMIERGDDSKHNYMKYLHLAIKGMQNLNFDISGMPSRVELEVSDNGTVVIPDDSLNIIGVSFNSGGIEIPFARSSNLSMAIDTSCGEDTYNDSSNYPMSGSVSGQVPTEAISNHVRNGEGIGGYYNSTTANPFLFRENDEHGTIELTSNAPSKIILEYLPTASQVGGQYLLSPFLEEPIIAWINWRLVNSKRNSSPGLTESLHRIYLNEKRHLDNRLTSMTKADFIEAVNNGRTASPRF